MSDPRARLRTGIAGLDDVLYGGLTPNRLYLLEGKPGSGKTTLALQFLLEGVRNGEPVLYVTLSETEEEITAVADSHGWTLDGIHVRELMPAEELLEPERAVHGIPSFGGRAVRDDQEDPVRRRRRQAAPHGAGLAVGGAPAVGQRVALPAPDPGAQAVFHRARVHGDDARRPDLARQRPAGAEHHPRRHPARARAADVRQGAPPAARDQVPWLASSAAAITTT